MENDKHIGNLEETSWEIKINITKHSAQKGELIKLNINVKKVGGTMKKLNNVMN